MKMTPKKGISETGSYRTLLYQLPVYSIDHTP